MTARPPFWQYAAKALTALLVGVVAAAGTITAAVADNRVSVSEWWAIGLAVAAAVVGPGAVYAVRNATTPTLAAVPDPQTPAVAGTTNPDGTVDVAWPAGHDVTDEVSVSRQLLEALVDQHNTLTRNASGAWVPPEPRPASGVVDPGPGMASQ